MKKYVPIAALVGAALALAGCSASADDPDPSASPTDAAGSEAPTADPEQAAAEAAQTLDAVQWDEDGDGVPALTVDTPASIASTATRSVNAGDGDSIVAGDLVKVDYTVTSGTDGSQVYSTYEAGAPELIPVNEGSLDSTLFDVLSNASVGEDLIFATLDQSAQDNPNAAIFMAMTITEKVVPLETAEGTEVEPEEGLPTVTLDESGAPSIDIGDADKPSDLVVQPLIEGNGEELALGDTMVAHYTGWLWDGEVFDSSWERGQSQVFQFTEGQLVEGWTDGLAGQKVGSQVLLVVPPEAGYGAEDNGPIPGDSTLVFVVDILGTVPAE